MDGIKCAETPAGSSSLSLTNVLAYSYFSTMLFDSLTQYNLRFVLLLFVVYRIRYGLEIWSHTLRTSYLHAIHLSGCVLES